MQLFNRWHSSKTPDGWKAYNDLKKHYREAIVKAKSGHIFGRISNANNKSAKSCKIIKEVQGKALTYKYNITLPHCGREVSEPEQVANLFNDYFANVAVKIMENVCQKPFSGFKCKIVSQLFKRSNISENQISSLICSLKPKTSCCMDGRWNPVNLHY